MWIELHPYWIAGINALGIPMAHLLIAWGITQLPESCFSRPLDKKEQNLRLYLRLFQIKRWKHYLPDGAPWLKGFSKSSLQSTEREYLETFVKETRRGECSHWLQWLAISCFIVWTPSPYHLIILIYATLSNLPCILNLRYTRIRLIRILHPSTQSI
ncbi:hypothetical protein HW115_00555 [Verrucomicrobiaceae bacterium N1E253]|uniref:Glycosyl-4,4'-diaponeurosporenoate acyltransferase n=1 Tax=Oceaniferula marina TaxID=2748318 RepID=A0A851GIN2_9BACT|nr:hypothetical protein [Oceaniferula marina]NWK54084.1 hypothetical protein [Oceaniferula marina]